MAEAEALAIAPDWQTPVERLLWSDPRSWTDAVLLPLSREDLATLARLLGIATGGTKPEVRARLLDMADLRGVLAEAEDPAHLTERFRLKELQAMCRRAGTFRGGNKRAAAVALLNWRNTCRQRGREFLDRARQNRPAQTRMRF